VRTIVVAPHPDDEVLGCGGTLLRRKAEGAGLAWLIATGMTEEGGWTAAQIRRRDGEIARVAEGIGFDRVYNLRWPTTRLDQRPMGELVADVARVFEEFQPEEVFLPNPRDAHTDHHIVFQAAAACTKWFRSSSIRRILAYETLSETDQGLGATFQPNWFVDITAHLDRKVALMAIYASELGTFPFPRSNEAIRALAATRGAASGFAAAEAFELLRSRE
jgi:N-acetylglucosamine malate deacetylase 1